MRSSDWSSAFIVTGLLDRLGISAEAIKSTPLKAQPSPLEPLSDEGRDALRAVIDDMYDFFVDLVAERRPHINRRDRTRSLILTAEDEHCRQECERYLREIGFHVFLHRHWPSC